MKPLTVKYIPFDSLDIDDDTLEYIATELDTGSATIALYDKADVLDSAQSHLYWLLDEIDVDDDADGWIKPAITACKKSIINIEKCPAGTLIDLADL